MPSGEARVQSLNTRRFAGEFFLTGQGFKSRCLLDWNKFEGMQNVDPSTCSAVPSNVRRRHLLPSLPRRKDSAVKVRFCLPTLNYVESRQEIIMWHLRCHQVLAKLYPAGPCDCYLMSECEWQWALARGQQQHGAVVGHESGIMKWSPSLLLIFLEPAEMFYVLDGPQIHCRCPCV